MSPNVTNAVSDALKGKGGGAETTAAHIQDIAMLNVVEKSAEDNRQADLAMPKYHTVSDLRRAQLWLDAQIKKSESGVFSEVATLTPELAMVLLDRNPGNRKVKQGKVVELGKDMIGGNWKLNGEAIIVSDDGLLNDGQHRCAAVVECKIPVQVVITFGVPRDSRDTLDQGSMRSAADYLDMHGVESAKHLAGAARALWQYQKFGFIRMTSMRHAPTRTEIKQVALEHPSLGRSVRFVSRRGVKAIGSVSLLAFCHFCFRKAAGEMAADYFMDALLEGASLKRGDPILYVRNRFIAEKSRMKSEEKVELLFRAWNAHRLDEQRQTLRSYGGELPLLEV